MHTDGKLIFVDFLRQFEGGFAALQLKTHKYCGSLLFNMQIEDVLCGKNITFSKIF